jgi:hypothetical protein
MFMVLAVTSSLSAATLWTGPNIGYNQPAPDPTQAANQDRVTPTVWITRGTRDRLFNAFSEPSCDRSISPTNTEWASSATFNSSVTNLIYHPFSTWVDSLGLGNVNPKILNVPAVLHIKSDDIYISIKFTNWVAGGGGGFGYIRSTAPIIPVVAITNPAAGAVFAAPANVLIKASASLSGGTITNVAFFANTTSLGSVHSVPFNLTANSLAAGAYNLTAVATGSGVSTTSSIVNISVVTPLAVTLSGVKAGNGKFSFNYTANAGLNYVVETSSNLLTWSALVTNPATGSPVPFTNNISGSPKFYRVGRLPNP